MAVNIKNRDAERLARELAELTGESMTAAIIVALGERLDRIRAHQCTEDIADRSARLLEIGRQTAPLMREPWASASHGDLLYDDRGLPA
jgi:antitoxin VapB